MVVLTDIYAAGEQPRSGVSGESVLRAVQHAHPDAEVVYVERREELAEVVASLLLPGDLCITVGAGDVTHLADQILALPGWSA